jgi:hypothetical protein
MSVFKDIRGLGRLVVVCGLVVVGVLVVGITPALAELRVERFALSARNRDGTVDAQAGSHPYALTSTIVLSEPGYAGGDLKDVKLELPPGLVGDPNATPKCGYQEFIREENRERLCPSDTAVGIVTTYLTKQGTGTISAITEPVYNLVPQAGVAAEFGFIVANNTPVLLDATVRTGSDYGVTETVPNVNQAVVAQASKVTIWGDPAEASHNPWRGVCERELAGGPKPLEAVGGGLREGEDELEGPLSGPGEEPEEGLPESRGECASGAPLVPLLTNPVSCGHPRVASVSVDSWQEPGVYRSKTATLPEIQGCGALSFASTLGVKPQTSVASTASGVDVGVHVPQEATLDPSGLAEADVRDTTVTLPAGLQLNASTADGLAACTTAQIGFTGFSELEPVVEPGVRTAQFTPVVPSCPDASKLANVRVKTPLLEGELTGGLYQAAPQNFTGLPENPFSSLLAVYLVAEEPKTGVLVKLAGHVEIGGEPGVLGLAPGQIRTSFQNTPQFPFSDLNVEFYGGERSALATPAVCGSYESVASFTTWSSGTPSGASSAFPITSGPHGAACSAPLPFSPATAAGGGNLNAGGFSSLTTEVTRADGQQDIKNVSLSFPPGVSGVLAGVPLCGEAQADAGTCGAESLIGEATASSGVGGDPYTVTGGKVYLTGPYDGAPFGLSIAVVAKAGPFVLQEGRPVVVRAKLQIDPVTAAVTAVTDPTGPYAIPQSVEGIPLNLRRLYVNINRAGFAINPTSCDPQTVTGTITGTEGGSSPVSTPFQVTNCPALKFAPTFTVSTQGHASKAGGASLDVKIQTRQGPGQAPGVQEANIRKVDVQLPKDLPSRLSTLQKACTEHQFALNPAGCPEASFVGTAVAHTPLLPVALEGPAILVSHGGAAFPDLEIILQGDNVKIALTGETDIKGGITYSRFETAPDAPFSSFELKLPEGPHSILGAYTPNGSYNLCTLTKTVTKTRTVTKRVNGRTRKVKQKVKATVPATLEMPTTITAQDGAVVTQNTKLAVTGCPTAATAKNAAASRARKGSKAARHR